MTNKLSNLQLLRALAILSVIFFHSTGFTGINTGLFKNIFQLGAAGVDLFFVISGFIIWHITQNRQHNPFHFIAKRYWRIMPMYWLVSCTLIILMFATGKTISTEKIASSLLLAPDPSHPILNVGWSLIHEMYFYVLFAALLIISSPKIRLTALWLWALSTSSYHFYTIPTSPWISLLTNPFNLEFTLGASLAFLMAGKPASSYQFWLHTGIASALTLVFWVSQVGWFFPESIERVIYFALPITLLVLAAVMSPSGNNLITAILEKLGDASYSIYLTHVPILALLNELAMLNGTSIHVSAGVTVCLFAGWLCYHCLEQPLLRLLPTHQEKQ